MARSVGPSASTTTDLDRVAGWVLLGGSALLIFGIWLYATRQRDTAVYAAALLVTLLGLIAFEESLRRRGEEPLPQVACFAFGFASVLWITRSALLDGGSNVYELEYSYTLIVCLANVLFGWSILRTKALPVAVGWFMITWGVLYSILYIARISYAPLLPNLALLVLGVALVASRRPAASPPPPADDPGGSTSSRVS